MQNNWVLSLSFNREQAGVDDAYGSKEEYFVSGGTRFNVPTKIGTLRFSTEVAPWQGEGGKGRFAGGIGWDGPIGNFQETYQWLEGAQTWA